MSYNIILTDTFKKDAKNDEEPFIDIEIKIVPNYEFENKILSIGEKIKVLEPLSFKTLIINRLKLNLENYK